MEDTETTKTDETQRRRMGDPKFPSLTPGST